ncbi:Hypp8604 [Branchiostoma lanceolatum]|uniref:Hypp8604 protein n=1 Tax=Branchiostoma lanceolatum TaxID=7740 RepID=A0A8J9Z949_BRALA|nr:Hypp8604 [Branchiostoma lanceolatum]
MERPVILVCDTLPFRVVRDQKTGHLSRDSRQGDTGGLQVTCGSLVKSGHGACLVGWPGLYMREGEEMPSGDVTDSTTTSPRALPSVPVVPVCELSPDDFAKHFAFAAEMVTPHLHSLSQFSMGSWDDWEPFGLFGRKFGRALLKALDGYPSHQAPVVWVHDGDGLLIQVANFLRNQETSREYTLSYTHHISFPPWEDLQRFPWSNEVMGGFLGYDDVMFNAQVHVDNFLACCREMSLVVKVNEDGGTVYYQGRKVKVRKVAPSCQHDKLMKLAQVAPPLPRGLKEGCKILLGAERVAYTKGLPERVRAFGRMLERYPEHVGRVSYYQVGVPAGTEGVKVSRVHLKVQEEVEKAVLAVNETFGTPLWTPIHYVPRPLPHAPLAGFYRDADVMLVTSLKDALNLVAKEYVSCQVNDPGVVVVSKYAGVSEIMEEALLCDPRDEDGLADIMHQALTMPLWERRARMNKLQSRQEGCTVGAWVRKVLKRLQ